MFKSTWRLTLYCFLVSGVCFFSLPFVHKINTREYEAKEPYFYSPLVTASQVLRIRNDGNAKGFFWAKRDGGRHHKGLDLLVEEGKPVLASHSGRVRRAGMGKGYGLYVEIVHPKDYETRYAHLSACSVQEGSWVEYGQIIGLSGRTGNANDPTIRPHLHFEIRLNGTPLNPAKNLLDPDLKIIS